MKKVSKKLKEAKPSKKKLLKRTFKGEILAPTLPPMEKRKPSIKSSEAIPVYEVRERREVSDRGIGHLLSQSRMQWQFGERERLTQIDLLHIEHHPDRAELALLAGTASLQLGDRQKASTYLKTSKEWECNERLMMQLLLSGVHHSLGRYHLLKGNEEKATTQIGLGGIGLGGDPHFITEIRTRKEVSALTRGEKKGSSDAPALQAQSEVAIPSQAELEEVFSIEKAIEEAARTESPFREGITSYAQNYEDVMLWRALGHVENGFYIDIGAQHPVIDSVSKAFYEKGWRGIHVEATSAYAKLIREDRPDEIVIEAAVSDKHGDMTFYEIPETGLSTGDYNYAELCRLQGFKITQRVVPTTTLSDIIAKAIDREIHWLKIDVEGMEKLVLQGLRLIQNKPWVLVIESIAPNSRICSHLNWEDYVTNAGYIYSYFDGINRFYIHRNSGIPKDIFDVPYNIFDGYRCNTKHN
jgi:FkbM family methyltransferase